jgi:UDP:flavonoid glycosyltransferase YjiC (YdhE family)
MKIGIQTWGSEGDVRPFLALAAGLRSAGHDVTLVVTDVTGKDHTALGATFGVPVLQAGCFPPDLAKHAGEVLVHETNILRQVDRILRDLFEPAAPDMLREAKRLCGGNDLVIGHFLCHPLRTAAELAGKPHVAVFLAPLLPSASYPPPGVPALGRPLNTLFWKIGGLVMNRMFLPRINTMRSAEGLPPLGNVMGEAFLSPRLNLVASSPSLFPAPPDWDHTIRQCGSFPLPARGGQQQLPDPLRQFLAAGPPPVYMTIGSMSAADPSNEETTRLFTEAAMLAGCRAIVQTGSPPVEPGPPDVLYIQQAEHHLVFPRCAAVVHHGGAGTSHAASRAGRPSIVVEHVTDQAFWGGVLHRAGIAPAVLHRRTVNAAVLARAITAVLSSSAMQEKARGIGESMRREDGVKRAVGLIEGHRWD